MRLNSGDWKRHANYLLLDDLREKEKVCIFLIRWFWCCLYMILPICLLYVSQNMQVYVNKNIELVLFLYNIDRLQIEFDEDVNLVTLYTVILF